MTTRSTDADMLARLRVAVTTGRIDATVAAWALRRIESRVSRSERDDLLRKAAASFRGGSWERAGRVLAMLKRVRHIGVSEHPSQVERLLLAAHSLDPDRPASRRQLHRILCQ